MTTTIDRDELQALADELEDVFYAGRFDETEHDDSAEWLRVAAVVLARPAMVRELSSVVVDDHLKCYAPRLKPAPVEAMTERERKGRALHTMAMAYENADGSLAASAAKAFCDKAASMFARPLPSVTELAKVLAPGM